MARTPVNFAKNMQLSTAPQAIVPVVATGRQSVVAKCSFYNTSATLERLITVHVVESGGTTDTGNILMTKSLLPGKSWNCVEILREVFTVGMSAQATIDGGTDVNVNCSGDSFSS